MFDAFLFSQGEKCNANQKKIYVPKFRAGDTTCEDCERSGRPLVVDDDQIKSLIENNPPYTTRKIAEIINVSQKKTRCKPIYKHLLRISVNNIWVPHNLSDKNLMDRISICDLLLKRNENCPFLKWMITGDEKWVVYNNVQRKRSWGKKINRHKSHRSKIFTRRKSCVFGGTAKELCIMNCFRKTRRLIPRNIVPNWTFEGSNRRKESRIVKSSWCRVSSRQR